MRRSQLRAVFPLSLLAMAAQAQNVVYVTDLPLYTKLASCAQYAISYAVMSQTYTNCPQDVTALQSCVCSKNQNLPSISTVMLSSVTYSCGSTASGDVASVQTVLSAYCNQASMPSFPTPAFPVSRYITDVPEFQNLAPCAQGALSYAVQSMTYAYCPPEATDLATCACLKNQNSLKISQIINTSVRYSCATHSADITSAQAMFAAYCAQNSGTTAFPVPSPPPGSMTYYITALPQFAALAPCAQSAISYVMYSATREYCPGGPMGLASCACLKESMSGSMSSLITSDVKYSCSSTATEDITSALAVFDFYCKAAANLVVATGVSESIAQTYATAASGGGQTPGPNQTGGTGSNGGNGNGSSGSTNGTNGTSQTSGPSTALIAGAAAGGVVVLIVIGVAAFCVMRSQRRKKAAAEAATAAIAMQDQKPPGYYSGDKAELMGNPIVGVAATGVGSPQSPSPSTLKPNNLSPRTDNISPVSAHQNSAFAPPPMPNKAELAGAGSLTSGSSPPPPSAVSSYGHSPPPPQSQYPGQYGQYYNQQQAPPPTSHEMQGHQTYSTMIRPELQGQNVYSPGGGGGYSPLAAPYGPQHGHHQHHPSQQSQHYHEFPGSGGAAPPHVHEVPSRPVTANSQHHLHQASSPHAEMPGMSWHSGPVAGYSELDGGYSRGGR